MVDDDSFVLMILSHVVADAGLEPVTCTTSARCLDLLRPDSFAQSPYTVLLLDWELADMNALQLLQQLDQGGEHLKDKMRIFVVSGSPPPDDFSAACAVLRYLTVEHWWTPVTAARSENCLALAPSIPHDACASFLTHPLFLRACWWA